MKLSIKRSLAITTAAIGLTAALPMSAASAINTTSCGTTHAPRTDVVKVTYIDHLSGERAFACFANAGAVDIRLHGVSEISTGNNDIRFIMSSGVTTDPGTIHTLSRWQTTQLGEKRVMTRLRIL